MNTYYMDVSGKVKEKEEWLNDLTNGEISLWDVKQLIRVLWNAQLQKWMEC